MTGPEHYKEAERLALLAGKHTEPLDALVLAVRALTEAQLANAAATALNDNHSHEGGMPMGDLHAWRQAASVEEKKGSS
ncbi:hypothetical protein [Streptomyces sp. NRRL B-1347]|uniref:hypothetical protein n=1 Tax=Streptomyces sp. NRRL B-1347 TaxID=1476877 RepID=UPI0004CAFB95|nr:hypothetical protein [Streptomyces sp. NRRL B-1347]